MKTFILLFLCMLLICIKSGAQNVGNNSQQPKIATDQAIMAKASAINAAYQIQVQRLISDTSLTKKDRQLKLYQLITAKNKELRQLFLPGSIVSTASLSIAGNRDSIFAKQYEAEHLTKKIGIDINKAIKVNAIDKAYRKAILAVITSRDTTSNSRKLAIDQLGMQRNGDLGKLLSPSQINLLGPVKYTVTWQSPLQSKTLTAIQDTFQYKISLVLSQKNLSEVDRRAQLIQLANARRAAINTIQQSLSPVKQ